MASVQCVCICMYIYTYVYIYIYTHAVCVYNNDDNKDTSNNINSATNDIHDSYFCVQPSLLVRPSRHLSLPNIMVYIYIYICIHIYTHIHGAKHHWCVFGFCWAQTYVLLIVKHTHPFSCACQRRATFAPPNDLRCLRPHNILDVWSSKSAACLGSFAIGYFCFDRFGVHIDVLHRHRIPHVSNGRMALRSHSSAQPASKIARQDPRT